MVPPRSQYRRYATGIALALAAALAIGPAALAADTPALLAQPGDPLPSLAPIVDKVLPAVVNISVVEKAGAADEEGDDQDDNDDQDQQQQQPMPGAPDGQQTPFDQFLRRFFEQQQQNRHGGGQMPGQKVMALGSGFIIDPTGYIVTNNHVIGDADKVTVVFQDDSKHVAKIIGKDAKTDLALLKIDAPQPLPFVKFGDSDKARVGDWVIAVGNPFGLGGTVTKGIISARGREPLEGQSYVDFLQVDASINKGNSGGPTFDLAGNVIGINTAIYSPNGGSVGIGFAIPSDAAKPVLDQLRATGKVDRGWLGVQIQEVTPEIASSLGMDEKHPVGALVAAVTDGSPAAKAGIKVGDVIEKYNGTAVDKMRDLPRLVGDTGIGKTVPITVLRGGQQVTVQTVVAQLDEAKVATASDETPMEKPNRMAALGLYLSPLNADIRKRLNLPKEVSGVLVSRVKEGSAAAEHGIEAGDVIEQVNGKPVGKPEDVTELAKPGKPGDTKSVLLLVNRQGQNRFIAIQPDDKNG